MAALAVALSLTTTFAVAGAAGADPIPPSASICTYIDTTQPSVVASSSVLAGVEPGDVLSVSCTNLPASTGVVVEEQSPLASVENPASLATDERGSTGGGNGLTDASGSLTATSFTVPVNGSGGSAFSATDPNATCPPTQAQVDAGLLACSLVVADASSGTALDSATLVYGTNQPSPAAPTLATNISAGANGDTVQVGDATGAVGRWWGNATQSLNIPASSIRVGTAPAASSSVTISPATYTVPVSAGIPQWGSASLTPPVLSGTFTVPSGVPAGPTTVSLYEPDSSSAFVGNSSNASFPGDVTAGAGFSMIDTTRATVSTDLAQAPNGSALLVSGSGWDPQGGPVSVEFSQTPTEPFSQVGTDHAGATVQPNGTFVTVLVVGPSETVGLTGPDAVSIVAAQQAVAGGTPTTIQASTPFTLEVGCATGAAGPTCDLLLSLSAQVQGSLLSMSELPTAGNPSATQVTLSSVTLSGQFSDASGQLSTILVNDDRGTLAGWSVTGQLETPFTNAAPTGPQSDNQIPADYLTWTPSVSLATTGSSPGTNQAAAGCPSGPTGPCPGPSGSLSEVQAGSFSALHDTTGAPVVLCSASAGGGGGSFDCAAALLLAVPPQIAAGTYATVLDLVLIGL